MNSLARFGRGVASASYSLKRLPAQPAHTSSSLFENCRAVQDSVSDRAAATSSEAHSFHSSATAEVPPPETRARPAPRAAGGQPPPGSGVDSAGPASASKLGTIYVQSTSNNTICTLVDQRGNPVTWCSAGSIGFKNARKSTTYAAQATAEQIASRSLEKGYFLVRVVMKGLGFGKQSAVRALFKSGLRISEIHELTPTPYNGCRAPKKRRV